MSDSAPAVQVGVGVVLFKNGRVMVGKRKGSLGDGTWALPGGKMNFGESFEACASRELEEETGLKIHKPHYVWACSTVFDSKQHYATIFVQGTVEGDNAEAKLLEPDKCSEWGWVPFNEIPEPRFAPLQTLIDSGFNPGDDREGLAVRLVESVQPVLRPSDSSRALPE